MTLFPVIMPVIEAGHKSSGKEKVDHLSRIAREALKVSAEKSQMRLGKLLKDKEGIPYPVAGTYWSLSHKPKYVAAVVSKNKVGIDIEEVKPRAESLFARVASDEEWELKEKSWDALFRYWTAKEAILKVIGIGIGGLKICRITSVPDENHITLDYEGQIFLVEQLRYKNHIVSVLKDDNQIKWVVLDKFPNNMN
ncbi:MAG: 4'-phosphopantetheinyl transferase superfamily protein [Dehalococcoidia bacterium]|jgi:4'-phosphopantetheinyl transferase